METTCGWLWAKHWTAICAAICWLKWINAEFKGGYLSCSVPGLSISFCSCSRLLANSAVQYAISLRAHSIVSTFWPIPKKPSPNGAHFGLMRWVGLLDRGTNWSACPRSEGDVNTCWAPWPLSILDKSTEPLTLDVVWVVLWLFEIIWGLTGPLRASGIGFDFFSNFSVFFSLECLYFRAYFMRLTCADSSFCKA